MQAGPPLDEPQVHLRALYEHLWGRYVAQRQLNSVSEGAVEPSTTTFLVLSAPGLEPRTLCFSAQSPTDGQRPYFNVIKFINLDYALFSFVERL